MLLDILENHALVWIQEGLSSNNASSLPAIAYIYIQQLYLYIYIYTYIAKSTEPSDRETTFDFDLPEFHSLQCPA